MTKKRPFTAKALLKEREQNVKDRKIKIHVAGNLKENKYRIILTIPCAHNFFYEEQRNYISQTREDVLKRAKAIKKYFVNSEIFMNDV